MMRAVGVGALLALLVVAIAVALVVSGVVRLPNADEPPDRLLVILTAPEAESAEVAVAAFALSREGDLPPKVLDTMRKITVPNTSAESAREAFPFVGGEGLAEVLAPQTGGELPWIVLPADEWGPMVERAGGIEVDVPDGLSVYRAGELVVLEKGEQQLDGGQAAALLSALEFVESAADRKTVAAQAGAALAEVVGEDFDEVVRAVGGKKGSTSLAPEQLQAFASGR